MDRPLKPPFCPRVSSRQSAVKSLAALAEGESVDVATLACLGEAWQAQLLAGKSKVTADKVRKVLTRIRKASVPVKGIDIKTGKRSVVLSSKDERKEARQEWLAAVGKLSAACQVPSKAPRTKAKAPTGQVTLTGCEPETETTEK